MAGIHIEARLSTLIVALLANAATALIASRYDDVRRFWYQSMGEHICIYLGLWCKRAFPCPPSSGLNDNISDKGLGCCKLAENLLEENMHVLIAVDLKKDG